MPLNPETFSPAFFRRLETFIAVAETLSFRRAAEMIGRSQPAVTSQINQLEDALGVKLLVRSTRQVRLTTAGAELLERGRRLLAESERLVRDIHAQAGLLTGQVVVSFSPTIAMSLAPKVLATFESEHPGIRVLLREELAPQMLEAILNGSVDVGIGPYQPTTDKLAFNPIFDQEFSLVIREDHPLAIRGHARIRDLANINLLCSSVGTTAREVLENAAKAEGITIMPKYEALQYPTLFALAAAGFGGTVMPAVNTNILSAMGLCAVPFRGKCLVRPIGIITRRDEALAPGPQAFVRLLLLTAEQESQHLAGQG
ncbi:LysR family transcriptional regulator [Billgrantia pellis]|uniref:LysR family transcriptional regulator n=1 Tax=Billgrantia pellis TaxID=2606936 RepID=A0A7V7KG23_9GAMM|nr:LysR family transcriptional regulator [Halomonas pellis]KAA0010043.1 LysR family transcriptional regulator [Halomonas pellis]